MMLITIFSTSSTVHLSKNKINNLWLSGPVLYSISQKAPSTCLPQAAIHPLYSQFSRRAFFSRERMMKRKVTSNSSPPNETHNQLVVFCSERPSSSFNTSHTFWALQTCSFPAGLQMLTNAPLGHCTIKLYWVSRRGLFKQKHADIHASLSDNA